MYFDIICSAIYSSRVPLIILLVVYIVPLNVHFVFNQLWTHIHLFVTGKMHYAYFFISLFFLSFTSRIVSVYSLAIGNSEKEKKHLPVVKCFLTQQLCGGFRKIRPERVRYSERDYMVLTDRSNYKGHFDQLLSPVALLRPSAAHRSGTRKTNGSITNEISNGIYIALDYFILSWTDKNCYLKI